MVGRVHTAGTGTICVLARLACVTQPMHLALSLCRFPDPCFGLAHRPVRFRVQCPAGVVRALRAISIGTHEDCDEKASGVDTEQPNQLENC